MSRRTTAKAVIAVVSDCESKQELDFGGKGQSVPLHNMELAMLIECENTLGFRSLESQRSAYPLHQSLHGVVGKISSVNKDLSHAKPRGLRWNTRRFCIFS
jgi:hypothetical protein